jgi:hypothetical protein
MVREENKVAGAVSAFIMGVVILLVSVFDPASARPTRIPFLGSVHIPNIVFIILGFGFLFVGTYLLGNRQLVFDCRLNRVQKGHKLWRYWRFKAESLTHYPAVCIDSAVKSATSIPKYEYRVYLGGGKKKLTLATFPEVDDAYHLASKMAVFLGVKIHDRTAGEMCEIEFDKLLPSGASPNGNGNGHKHEMPSYPEAPPGCRIGVDVVDHDVIVSLPKHEWEFRQKALIAIAITILVVVPLWLIPVLRDVMEENPFAGWGWYASLLSPVLAIAVYCFFAALDESRRSERITLKELSMTIHRRGRLLRREARIDYKLVRFVRVLPSRSMRADLGQIPRKWYVCIEVHESAPKTVGHDLTESEAIYLAKLLISVVDASVNS